MPTRTKNVKMWRFHTSDIMDATGYERAKVRYDIREGKVTPRDLGSLAAYVVRANPALLIEKP